MAANQREQGHHRRDDSSAYDDLAKELLKLLDNPERLDWRLARLSPGGRESALLWALKTSNGEKKSATDEVKRLKSELATARKNEAGMQKEISQLAEKVVSSALVKDSGRKLKEGEVVRGLREKVHSVTRERDEAERELRELKKSAKWMEDGFLEADKNQKSELGDLRKELDEAKDDIDALWKEGRRKSESLQRQMEKRDGVERELRSLQEEHEVKLQEMEDLRRQLKWAEQQNKRRQMCINKMAGSRKAKQEIWESQNRELSRLREKLNNSAQELVLLKDEKIRLKWKWKGISEYWETKKRAFEEMKLAKDLELEGLRQKLETAEREIQSYQAAFKNTAHISDSPTEVGNASFGVISRISKVSNGDPLPRTDTNTCISNRDPSAFLMKMPSTSHIGFPLPDALAAGTQSQEAGINPQPCGSLSWPQTVMTSQTLSSSQAVTSKSPSSVRSTAADSCKVNTIKDNEDKPKDQESGIDKNQVKTTKQMGNISSEVIPRIPSAINGGGPSVDKVSVVANTDPATYSSAMQSTSTILLPTAAQSSDYFQFGANLNDAKKPDQDQSNGSRKEAGKILKSIKPLMKSPKTAPLKESATDESFGTNSSQKDNYQPRRSSATPQIAMKSFQPSRKRILLPITASKNSFKSNNREDYSSKVQTAEIVENEVKSDCIVKTPVQTINAQSPPSPMESEELKSSEEGNPSLAENFNNYVVSPASVPCKTTNLADCQEKGTSEVMDLVSDSKYDFEEFIYDEYQHDIPLSSFSLGEGETATLGEKTGELDGYQRAIDFSFMDESSTLDKETEELKDDNQRAIAGIAVSLCEGAVPKAKPSTKEIRQGSSAEAGENSKATRNNEEERSKQSTYAGKRKRGVSQDSDSDLINSDSSDEADASTYQSSALLHSLSKRRKLWPRRRQPMLKKSQKSPLMDTDENLAKEMDASSNSDNPSIMPTDNVKNLAVARSKENLGGKSVPDDGRESNSKDLKRCIKTTSPESEDANVSGKLDGSPEVVSPVDNEDPDKAPQMESNFYYECNESIPTSDSEDGSDSDTDDDENDNKVWVSSSEIDSHSEDKSIVNGGYDYDSASEDAMRTTESTAAASQKNSIGNDPVPNSGIPARLNGDKYAEASGTSENTNSASSESKILGRPPGSRFDESVVHGKDDARDLFCLCGKEFKGRRPLWRHVKYYNGHWMTECNICHMQFRIKQHLDRHIRGVHAKAKKIDEEWDPFDEFSRLPPSNE